MIYAGTVKGVVKGNVVILEDDAHLPEGATVEVRVVEPAITREEAFARILEDRAASAGLKVHMDELLEEDKQEREEHPDRWLFRE
jgi:hypothetical protein